MTGLEEGVAWRPCSDLEVSPSDLEAVQGFDGRAMPGGDWGSAEQCPAATGRGRVRCRHGKGDQNGAETGISAVL